MVRSLLIDTKVTFNSDLLFALLSCFLFKQVLRRLNSYKCKSTIYTLRIGDHCRQSSLALTRDISSSSCFVIYSGWRQAGWCSSSAIQTYLPSGHSFYSGSSSDSSDGDSPWWVGHNGWRHRRRNLRGNNANHKEAN